MKPAASVSVACRLSAKDAGRLARYAKRAKVKRGTWLADAIVSALDALDLEAQQRRLMRSLERAEDGGE